MRFSKRGGAGVALLAVGLLGAAPAMAADKPVPPTPITITTTRAQTIAVARDESRHLSPHVRDIIRNINEQAHRQEEVSAHGTAGYNPFLAPAPFEKTGAYNRLSTEVSPPPNDL